MDPFGQDSPDTAFARQLHSAGALEVDVLQQALAEVRLRRAHEPGLTLADYLRARGLWGAPTPGSFSVGERVGSYLIQAHLAQGGMGDVYRAVDESTGSQVAVKTLNGFDIELVERFAREAQLAARADQRGGVVRVHTAGAHRGVPFLVMELIEGEELEQAFARGLMAPEELAKVMATIGRTVARCHSDGIVHRDLKPSNVLLCSDGRVLVADFGLAYHADVSRLTQTGQVLGTPAYMAPEQALDSARATAASVDVYALGAILYHGLCGRRPYPGSALIAVLSALTTGPPPRPSALEVDVDEGLEALCLLAMDRDPSRRPSAEALAEALEAYRSPDSSPPGGVLRPLALVFAVVAVALTAALLARPQPADRRSPAPTPDATAPPVEPPGPAEIEAAVDQALEALVVESTDERAFEGDDALRPVLERLAQAATPELARHVEDRLEQRAQLLAGELTQNLAPAARIAFFLRRLRWLCQATGAQVPAALLDRVIAARDALLADPDEALVTLEALQLCLAVQCLDPAAQVPADAWDYRVGWQLGGMGATGPKVSPIVFLLGVRNGFDFGGGRAYTSAMKFGDLEAFDTELARHTESAAARFLALSRLLYDRPPERGSELLAGLDGVLEAPVQDLHPSFLSETRYLKAEFLVEFDPESLPEALRICQEALACDPLPSRRLAAGTLVLERLLRLAGRLEEVHAVWGEALERMGEVPSERIRDTSLLARIRRGSALRDLGRPSEALLEFEAGLEEARRVERGSSELAALYVATCTAMGRLDEATTMVGRWPDEHYATSWATTAAVDLALARGKAAGGNAAWRAWGKAQAQLSEKPEWLLQLRHKIEALHGAD